MKEKIISWLRTNLGIDELKRDRIRIDSRLDKIEELSMMGIDLGVSERSDSYIVIATKLNGGVVKIIPLRPENPREVIELINNLENRYGIRNVIKDFPRGLPRFDY